MIIDMPTIADIPALRALWREAFGDGDAFLDSFFSTAYSSSRARLTRVDGDIAGALYWFDCECDGEKFAYIYAVATAKKHRGKGICTSLMDDTHAHLKALGYAGAILVPGEESLIAFYEKIGYAVCSSADEISVKAGHLPCPITRVTKKEYRLLRRRYLPNGGVLQEGEGLDFLSTMAMFYKGRDFILAADIKGDKLVGLELLGNKSTENAAAITAALGAAEGRFRVPGTARPFAMHLPLSSSKVPTYFGIAFD